MHTLTPLAQTVFPASPWDPCPQCQLCRELLLPHTSGTEMEVPLLAPSWCCWLTSPSSLPQTDRSQLSWHWNTKGTQQCFKQKPFLLCCGHVWVFSCILKKDALLLCSGSRRSWHKINDTKVTLWSGKGDFSPHPEPTAYLDCPSALGQALCPTTFLVLVITIADPPTHTEMHLPDTCVDH